MVCGFRKDTDVEIEPFCNWQRFGGAHYRLASIFPCSIRQRFILLVLLWMLLDKPIHHVTIKRRSKLKDVEQLLILAFRVCLQATEQFDHRSYTFW